MTYNVFFWWWRPHHFVEGPMTMHTSDGAELTIVSDEDPRAAAIRERRVRLGIRSQVAAEAESKRLGHSISRDAIMAAEKGTASDASYARLNALYDAFEEEIGQDDDEHPAEHMVTVKLAGNFGVRVTLEGNVDDEAALASLTAAILREMRTEESE